MLETELVIGETSTNQEKTGSVSAFRTKGKVNGQKWAILVLYRERFTHVRTEHKKQPTLGRRKYPSTLAWRAVTADQQAWQYALLNRNIPYDLGKAGVALLHYNGDLGWHWQQWAWFSFECVFVHLWSTGGGRVIRSLVWSLVDPTIYPEVFLAQSMPSIRALDK